MRPLPRPVIETPSTPDPPTAFPSPCVCSRSMMPDGGQPSQCVVRLRPLASLPSQTRRIGTSLMETPYLCAPRRVERAWIDYNGHMNMAYYNLVFDQALDQVFDDLGIGAAY